MRPAETGLLRRVAVMATFALGALHVWPATKHLQAFFLTPGVTEAWKGFGALAAVALLVLPWSWKTALYRRLRKPRALEVAVRVIVVGVHLVPASEHLPALLASPSWADGWRGLGSCAAILFMLTPSRVFGRAWRASADLSGHFRTLAPLAAALLAILVAVAGGSHRAQAHATAVLHVPRAEVSIAVDGELDESQWQRAEGRTGALLGKDGSASRIYSDGRLAHDGQTLFVALYAADENIVASHDRAEVVSHMATGDDFLRVTFRLPDGSQRTLEVAPSCARVARSRQGDRESLWVVDAKLSCDTDGTLNDATDDDEEWIVELALPLHSLSLSGMRGERIGFNVERCDSPRRALTPVCTEWSAGGGFLELE